MTTALTNVTASPAPLTVRRVGALASVELCRPERKNAVNAEMVAALRAPLSGLAKDPAVYAMTISSQLPGVFSVGGDVRELLETATSNPLEARTRLASELQLCWLLECFSKPTVSLIDGLAMGTGVGISVYGTHRIAGERYRFSMPETAIGYFPDCGLAHAFARMPPGIGNYLGLTGCEIGPADALELGLVTHVVSAGAFADISRLLSDAEPVDPVLDSRHAAPAAAGELMASAGRVARYFDASSVPEILRRLEQPVAEDQSWATETIARLRERSPLALCLTHRAISNARGLDIRQTLEQDYRLAVRLIEEPEFREGIRAHVIDKDHKPRWRHSRVEDVPPSDVDAYFSSLGGDELALRPRSEMQQLRT